MLEIGVLVTIGCGAAAFFWRIINHVFQKVCAVDTKVDHIIENMVTKNDCADRRLDIAKAFNGHFHPEEGGVAVMRKEKNQC